MNTPAEPFAGRLLAEDEVQTILAAVQYAEAGRSEIGTGRGRFTVSCNGDHVLVDLPSERRFLLALRSGIPRKGLHPLGTDDVEAGFLLPSLGGEPPPRKLVVPGTIPLRPMTPAELSAAVDVYRDEVDTWNRHESTPGLPLLRDVIRGVRLADTAPNARGLTFELLDLDGCGSGLYAAFETLPGWRKWRGPLLSFRRAMLTEDDVFRGTWLINPREHLAAKVRSALRAVH